MDEKWCIYEKVGAHCHVHILGSENNSLGVSYLLPPCLETVSFVGFVTTHLSFPDDSPVSTSYLSIRVQRYTGSSNYLCGLQELNPSYQVCAETAWPQSYLHGPWLDFTLMIFKNYY